MTDEITRLVRFTSKGLDEVLQAKNQGLKAEITHIGAGTGRYTPDGTEVALRDERQRVAIVDYEDLGERQLRMAALFDGDGEYEIGEFGFYLASGTLLAVYSVAGKLLTYKAAAARVLQKFTLDISPLPADSVTIVVGGDNLNILLAEDIAVLATANIDNMARQTELLFRVITLEASR
ncbi:Phage tail fiber protein [Pseudomonas sp. R4-39-08]|uniref:phage tail protein n=1 Tax=Pseudomonas sp. R4-39-08 TaxID=1173288 RepID=UPI000F5686DC|nr:phage tail protein [Pseudomonas sp. R4-39-08]AZF35930.1 Phage tail fiber protein [Pseudomonas sp. R4-39-08]